LSAASRDLSAIDECLHAVDHLISTANHFISRTERIINRTLKVREAMVDNLRCRYPPAEDPFVFDKSKAQKAVMMSMGSHAVGAASNILGRSSLSSSSGLFYLAPSDDHSNSSSSLSSSPSSSARSSLVSLVTTLRDEEDEDTKALRRLVLRKIGAHVDGAYEEVDRANTWLCVVRTVLRDLSTKLSSSPTIVS